MMKKITFILITVFSFVGNSFGYQVVSTKEIGKGDAKNQNVIVKCTTDTGKMSSEKCSLRRYAKCSGKEKQTCNSWQPWRDLRNTTGEYSDWQSAATACCKNKGLR